jgi:aminoglycoside phosphotransferase (APT) family kinase protein
MLGGQFINPSLVQELVAAQFPAWADLPIHRVEVGGHDNRSFRLGSEMSVRLPSHERYVAQVQKEQHWLPRLSKFLPLPIPVPLAMGVPSDLFPWRWSVYRWLEGENATIGPIHDLRGFAARLAQFLSHLQQLDSAGQRARPLRTTRESRARPDPRPRVFDSFKLRHFPRAILR